MKPNDGGPAFPRLLTGTYPGMSMRDWFAGMALRGIMGRPINELLAEDESLAKEAYSLADAMLAEREKEVK